ncbi:MAG: DEAD/DEAH box helicase [Myxococcota bacterium]|nr:DEAD/DEAH box helicase [Myxococcota bacterium]
MPPSSDPSFASLGLSEALRAAIRKRGFTRPTRVQAAVIPAALANEDVWASAPTGSGKTAAYVLPLLEAHAARDPRRDGRGRRAVEGLILCPTRELASQIGEEITSLGARLPSPPVTQVVFGGVSINPQMLALRGGADLVVATPGRLLDLVSKNALSLSRVSTLVLDEADRLLRAGFEDELTRVVAAVPEDRQTLLLSATFPPEVEALARATLRASARVVTVTSEEDAPELVERVIEVDTPKRTPLLRHLLEESDAQRVLVFVATTYSTGHVARKLTDRGVAAMALHGKLSQGARTRALEALRRGEVRVLVATDVAARGLHVEGLDMVVSYDLPRSPDDYRHRVGRTGRDRAGVAVSFVTADMRAHFRLIERRERRRLPREHVPGFEPEEEEVQVTRSHGTGGIKGKRKSKKDKLREAAARRAAAEAGASEPNDE